MPSGEWGEKFFEFLVDERLLGVARHSPDSYFNKTQKAKVSLFPK